MIDVYAVILAGGPGTRFWPASKLALPKQFLDLMGTGETLLQSTFRRYAKVVDVKKILIVSNKEHVDLVRRQLPQVEEDQILVEPVRRSTAPCLLYASHKVAANNPNAILIVAPSDHVVTEEKKFRKALNKAVQKAEDSNKGIVIGVPPTEVVEDITYMQYEESKKNEKPFYKLKTFADQPDRETAEAFFQSGDFLWYTGILLWKPTHILKAFEKRQPELAEMFKEGEVLYNTPGERTFIEHIYPMCPNVSLKEGFLYKLTDLVTMKTKFHWGNLINWNALWENKEKDYMGNAVSGDTVVMYDSSNCIVHIANNKLLIVQGLENYLIIDSPNALLIANRDGEKDFKNINSIVKRKSGDKYL